MGRAARVVSLFTLLVSVDAEISIHAFETTRNREEMMTSPAKVAANILNAKKSTGPRTDAGKGAVEDERVVTHGLTASGSPCFRMRIRRNFRS